ncbi:hypothetical protein FD961_09325 [Polynucleobacter sp. TSB-Sco08W16]|uniref:hypothetical protein n=1 Tax=Polynucleobacter sp. TSB-Sco08W16 TaxID=1758374 RepID=UPI001BFCDA34|nr:hypothetical protein [Polynucleobacter sp. TSB-Sco08W16]QWD75247.1 hypothetical protein FD961_09325 [Polynucleobacter sp. TSB-Sco08W16]
MKFVQNNIKTSLLFASIRLWIKPQKITNQKHLLRRAHWLASLLILSNHFPSVCECFSGSWGLIADGIHSAANLVADFVVLFAIIQK